MPFSAGSYRFLCERASSKNGTAQLQNEEILRDFLQTWKVDEKLRAELTASCQCALPIFRVHPSIPPDSVLPHEKLRPGHPMCCCHAKSGNQKSNAPKCNPSSAVSETAIKSTFLTLIFEGACSSGLATKNDAWSSKSGPNMVCFAILTWKRASRRNYVHFSYFFDISTSQSDPRRPVNFNNFDCETRFTPKPR